MPGTATRTEGPGRLLLYALAAVAGVLALIWLWEGAIRAVGRGLFALLVAPATIYARPRIVVAASYGFRGMEHPVVQKLAGRATLGSRWPRFFLGAGVAQASRGCEAPARPGAARARDGLRFVAGGLLNGRPGYRSSLDGSTAKTFATPAPAIFM